MFKLRVKIIYGTFVAPLVAFILASFSEWALETGYVKWITIGIFIGSSIIALCAITGFLIVILIQFLRHECRYEYVLPVASEMRIFVPQDNRMSSWRELGSNEPKMNISVDRFMKFVEPLDETLSLDEDLCCIVNDFR